MLGDIPIIGEFFKHTSKTRDKRELIIVVTPYLVGAEEISQSPMSQAMREWYDQHEQERENMETHDFKKSEDEIFIETEDKPIDLRRELKWQSQQETLSNEAA